MKFELKRKIGDAEWLFSGEAKSTQNLFKMAQFLTGLPVCCDHCKGTDISFLVRHPKGYTYYSIVCNNEKCGWELEYGEHLQEKGGGLFQKQWGPPYDPNAPQNARGNGQQGGWATQPNPNNPQGRQQQNNQPLPPPPEFAPPGDMIEDVPF